MVFKEYKGYKISRNGIVLSRKNGKPMTTSINHKGYEQIYIVIDGKKLTTTVHRLVAICFVDNPNGYTTVNHKDGDKLNNNADNLEWMSNSDNNEHAYVHGLKERKPIRMFDAATGKTKDFKSIKDCADSLGVEQYSVSRVCSGIRNTLFGRYTFEYL